MERMFYRATAFNKNIDSWNTSNVTSMNSMFLDATAFDQYIGSWNTSNVTIMANMFQGASNFNQNIRGWTLVSGIISTDMFLDATAMNTKYTGVTGFNYPTPVNSFFNQFTPANTEDFNNAIAYYFTTSTTTQEEALTIAGYSLASIGQFTDPVTQNAISNWNTHNVTSMNSTFINQHTFNIDIRLWDTSQVTEMSRMFSGCNHFQWKYR